MLTVPEIKFTAEEEGCGQETRQEGPTCPREEGTRPCAPATSDPGEGRPEEEGRGRAEGLEVVGGGEEGRRHEVVLPAAQRFEPFTSTL